MTAPFDSLDRQLAKAAGMPVAPAPKIDGRHLRAEATRQRITRAVRSLVREDRRWPLVTDIADTAGVSVRSIYQNYDGVAELMRAALTADDVAHIAAGLRGLTDRELVEAVMKGRVPESAL